MLRWLALYLFSICCTPVVPAAAQVLYGSLTGTITDSSGAAVPDAKLEALNKRTGVARTATTDSAGAYLFNDLQAGFYKVTVSAPSFRTVIQDDVEILTNSVRRIDMALQVAQVSETVNVSASTVILQTDRAEISAQMSQRQISELPIGVGRNFQQLYKLIPGFSPPADAHSDAGNPQRAMVANINGVSRTNNNTRLDGATVSYPWLPHIVAYVPPAEAIEAVNVVTNSFDAEQGLAGGAAINVSIRSGTNEFHGSGHWFHTNSALSARNFFFVGSDIPKNLYNQFGGTFGGPIKKNKLFFFGNFERTTRRQFRSIFRTIPSDALKAGNFAGAGAQIYDPLTGNPEGSGRQLFANGQIPSNRIDPAAAKMAALIPQPNQPTFPSNYFATGVYEFNRNNADMKVNYNPTDKSSVFARYSISPSDIFDPPSLGEAGGDALAGGQPGNAPGRVQSASVGGTYTVSPTVLVDGNLGFTRQRLGAENIDIDQNYGLDFLGIPGTNGPDHLQGGFPRFTFNNTFSSVGNPNVSNPFLFRDQQFVAAGNVSWVKGSHSMRFGGEYAYYTINHFQPETGQGPRGGFTFTGGLTALQGGAAPSIYNAWADFLLGLPQSLGKSLQYLNPDAVRMPSWGFYVRDQWQISRKLTLNYGVRYEYYPFARRDHRGADRYDPETNQALIGGLGDVPDDTGVDVGIGQLAPRFGIAYRMTEKTVIRAGYGISVDPTSFRHLRNSYPATIASQIAGATSFQAGGSLQSGIPPVVGPDLSAGIIAMPSAVSTQTFPQRFNRGYIQSFNFTVQRDIGAGFSFQAAYVGSRAIRQTANLNINHAGPGGGNNGRVLAQRWGRVADTNVLTPFSTANYNAFQTQLNRRVGNSQLGVAYTWSKAINFADDSDSGLIWNWIPMWNRNRAPAGFDRTHNFQVFGLYELPFGRGKRYATDGWAAALAGGWQVNGVFSWVTGTPFFIRSAGASVNAPGSTQTADQVKPEVNMPRNVGRGEAYWDPNAFAPVTDVRFGTSGRNILRGPGLVNLDASLFRNFRMAEWLTMQFRAEVFNVSNTPAFNNPSDAATTVSNATRVNGVITNLNGYGEINSAQATERQFRFAVKLFF